MTKIYKTAPLPFQGQKRRFLKQFKECLNANKKASVYVDLFGGSGLLSHTVKSLNPDATVIYNDYDNFRQRIESIPVTNKILSKLRVILAPCERQKKIPEQLRQKVLKVLELEQKRGNFIDYITLSSSLLFSMNYVQSFEEIKKQAMYNCVRRSDYSADGYLDDLVIVNCDYKELFEQYKDKENVVFLVDPPYLSTDCSTYTNYWKLKDYLDVLNVLDGTNYFYFTSNKSNIVELCEWIETRSTRSNPFAGSEVYYFETNTTHNTGYTDIMHHKWKTTTT